MNKTLVSILIVFCLIGSLPSLGSAATNQGLDWGVEVGDRFDYHIQLNNIEFNCYIVVESLPVIQNDISEIIRPTIFNVTPDVDRYFANGTVAGWWGLDFTQLVVPTGNWSLWSALLEKYVADYPFVYDSINATETTTSWTWTATSRIDFPDFRSLEETATFRKSSGVLNFFQYTLFTSGGEKDYELVIQQMDFIARTGFYFLAIGYIVALIAAVILFRKK